MTNYNISHLTIAKHFTYMFSTYRSASKSLLELKNKWDKTNTGKWELFVKAYHFDKGVDSDNTQKNN